MKQHPSLQMQKLSDAYVTWGDYGYSSPQGPGDFSWRKPAEWRVTGPSGTAYIVTGTESRWMQRSDWYYHLENDETKTGNGRFRNRAKALEHIDKREQAMLATQ
jgi:hypothetical protein